MELHVSMVHQEDPATWSDENAGYDDYAEFLALFGVKAAQDQMVFLTDVNGVSLYSGWATGNVRYLDL
jgi:hypothetical protein